MTPECPQPIRVSKRPCYSTYSEGLNIECCASLLAYLWCLGGGVQVSSAPLDQGKYSHGASSHTHLAGVMHNDPYLLQSHKVKQITPARKILNGCSGLREAAPHDMTTDGERQAARGTSLLPLLLLATVVLVVAQDQGVRVHEPTSMVGEYVGFPRAT